MWGIIRLMDRGQRIKKARKSAKLTQDALAKKLSVTGGAISQWENGLTVATADNYLAIADATGFSYRWLITGQLPEQPVNMQFSAGRQTYLETCDIEELKEILRSATDRLTSST